MSHPTDQEFLTALGERLRTQDNLGSAEPVWILQEKKRRYHIDTRAIDADGWTLTDGTNDLATSTEDPGDDPPEGWHWETTSEADGLVLVDPDGEEMAEAKKDSRGAFWPIWTGGRSSTNGSTFKASSLSPVMVSTDTWR